MSGQREKRIWYQGFTDPEEHHEYFSRLQALVAEVAEPGVTVDCHGIVPSAKYVHGLTEFRCAGQAIRNAIEAEKQGRSLMPDGLADPLTRSELVDLVRFLSELGKVGRYAVGKEQFVRRWQALANTPEGRRRLNRTSYDTAASDDAALTWLPVYSQVSGQLPVKALPSLVIHRDNDPVGFTRFALDVTTADKVRLLFADVKGLTLWVDGKPTTIANSLDLDLSRGLHILTLAVNQKQRTAPLRVQLTDAPGSKAQAQIVGGK